MDVATRNGAQIIPIDSEHNAIFQCLPAAGERFKGVRRLLLTASGGPFRGRQRAEIESITPDKACAHTNWVIGRKTWVDRSAARRVGKECVRTGRYRRWTEL